LDRVSRHAFRKPPKASARLEDAAVKRNCPRAPRKSWCRHSGQSRWCHFQLPEKGGGGA
jgi:hypothetical protein